MAEPIERTTPPSSRSTDPPKSLKSDSAPAPDRGAAENRVVGDDVVSNTRMHRHGHTRPVGMSKNRVILPAMMNEDSSSRPALLEIIA